MVATYTDQQIHEWLKYADAVASGRVRLSEATIAKLVDDYGFRSPFARELALDRFRNSVIMLMSAYSGEYGGDVIEALRTLYENREG